ncbi:hypothetical protein [Actinomadura verrucosospora]
MTVLWTALLSSVGVLAVGVVVSALRDEVRGRLDQMPRALLRLAGHRLPYDVRSDLVEEWEAELEAVLTPAAGLPITRLIVGTRYSLGLLRVAPKVAGELTGVTPTGLPLRAWLYVGGVVGSAAIVIGTSPIGAAWPTVVSLAALFLVCESSSAKLNFGRINVSLGYAASLAAVVLLGPAGAALVGATATISRQRALAPVKRLFNGAQFALSGYAASVGFQLLHNASYQPGRPTWLEHVVGPFLVALVIFVSVNLLLVAGILLLSRQAAWRDLLRGSGYRMVGGLGYGMTGLLIAGLWDNIGVFSAPLVLLPLVIARWAIARPDGNRRAQSGGSVAAVPGGGGQTETRQVGATTSPALPHYVTAMDRAGLRRRGFWKPFDLSRLLLIVVAGLVILSTVSTVTGGPSQPEVALAFGGLISLGELLRIVLPGNRQVAPIATASAMGYALLVGIGPQGAPLDAPLGVVPAEQSALQVVAVTAAGMLVGSLPRIVAGHIPPLAEMARRLFVIAAVALCFRPMLSLGLPWQLLLTVMGLVAVLSCFADMLIAVLIQMRADRARSDRVLHHEIKANMALWAATCINAILVALATTAMGMAALLIFTVPLMVTQFAFRRYAEIHGTAHQASR